MADPNCAVCHGTGHFNGVSDPCTRCVPVPEGLDFAEAKLAGAIDFYPDGAACSWDTDKYEAALNTQVAERIAEARREERAKYDGTSGPMACPHCGAGLCVEVAGEDTKLHLAYKGKEAR